ncbi:hypothetical protein E1B28_004008 [Marasmius oreades]|uniref:NADP-dependent oxidoreductase domain-containing protein n=1 Tax=Marasmius oreades TaxID=181124 RepID=A0A9P7UXP4_9AGAR|nr:uncharacterized protein E1B28_004008 [Marasmius oreades]KAG7096589.1 hypothetical protein E1B28_004008 [Marasmius oreades]
MFSPPLPQSLVVPNEIPPEEPDDTPLPGLPISDLDGPLNLPGLVFGAATFSNFYNADSHLTSLTPVRTTRLALRYGICAFDTSIYYGPSEVVLGNALKVLEKEFPRSSYRLFTKCGRLGGSSFDYSPSAIRKSVKKSLERLQTDYLDVVYLHDSEFVASEVTPRKTGQHALALTDERGEYGLRVGDEGVVHGDGDQKILEAFAELRQMKKEGLVKYIGLTAYPVPTLLRLSLLILHTAPFEPVDVVMSYSHLTLQNTLFADFASQFRERARVGQLLNASPLSMGLLSQSIPPWHPAPVELRNAIDQARNVSGGDIVDVSLGYAMRKCEELGMPLVTGLSNTKEVHDCVRVWREVRAGIDQEERLVKEQKMREILRDAGVLDWSWSSP